MFNIFPDIIIENKTFQQNTELNNMNNMNVLNIDLQYTQHN